MKSPKRQQGVAIITVLLIVVIVTVLAVQMSGRLRLQIARVISSDHAEQAYWHWMSAESLVRQVLLAELEEDDNRVHLEQNWATQQGPFPVRNGMIAGEIKDLHSCFNLNALYKNEEDLAALTLAMEQYQALLEALEFDQYTAERLTATLIDWIDKDSQLHSNLGAEDADYESLPQPYQAANSLLSHRSELRQIMGYTQEVYERLRPFVCVIPAQTQWRLNLNTVPEDRAELIVAFFRGQMDMNSAQSLLGARPQDGFADVESIQQQTEIQNLVGEGQTIQGLPEIEALTVESQYFELRAAIQYGDLEFYGVSQLHITNGEAYVVHRSRGGYETDERTDNNSSSSFR
ncbi:MAG: type II secretion system minor pseudopilin GspK [Aliidiomarina sp.]|uniref:type II secretion system minor pseudopilin GspK n=1 Tax=Aliidiomarina sp. TaxID=1872439 RepID=UPI0025BD58DA|nr:type II secretion system minor pseudopilin GspK [Aliidiomarina sp.]MCH8502279.1 type II secretion system minor pseudopilin GspK [Aliidiomarina sp.]